MFGSTYCSSAAAMKVPLFTSSLLNQTQFTRPSSVFDTVITGLPDFSRTVSPGLKSIIVIPSLKLIFKITTHYIIGFARIFAERCRVRLLGVAHAATLSLCNLNYFRLNL